MAQPQSAGTSATEVIALGPEPLVRQVAKVPKKTRFYGAHLCAYPEFSCVKVQRGDTWETLFTDPYQRDLVQRLNRTNTSLRYRSWIVVPSELDRVDLMALSPFPLQLEPTGESHLVVKLNALAFGAYDEHGHLIHWGPIAGGKDWCPDTQSACRTKTGQHKIYRKQGAKCQSSVYPLETNGGAPMPYCMHYYRGYALHGGQLPGDHASHGCVRLYDSDAKWLNHHFLKIGSAISVEN